jgi:hypothetical protein
MSFGKPQQPIWNYQSTTILIACKQFLHFQRLTFQSMDTGKAVALADNRAVVELPWVAGMPSAMEKAVGLDQIGKGIESKPPGRRPNPPGSHRNAVT